MIFLIMLLLMIVGYDVPVWAWVLELSIVITLLAVESSDN